MKLKEYFEKLSINDIHQFVEEQRQEDVYLDFKQANFPDKKSLGFDDKNFSKCLSGFSNSVGGLIIWGVKASKNDKGVDCAKELKPIENVSKFCNRLKRLEGTVVSPQIQGVEYKILREPDQNDLGFLICYVPQSDSCPHMALKADSHYIKRSGDSFYICEHYDIMDMINRTRKPKLELTIGPFILRHSSSSGGQKFYALETIFSIFNKSTASAKFPKIELSISPPFKIHQYGLDGNGSRGLKTCTSINYQKGYFGGHDIIIHGGSTLNIDKIVYKNDLIKPIEPDFFYMKYQLVADGIPPIEDEIRIDPETIKKQIEI